MKNLSFSQNDPFALPMPKWFNIVAILALVWNVMGVMAFVMQMMMTDKAIAKLPEAEQALYMNIPLWATIAFGFAVFGGLLGAFALVFKKRIASLFLILSLIGVIVQMFYNFVLSNSFEVYGPGGAIMPVMVVVIAFVLVKLASVAKSNRWLR